MLQTKTYLMLDVSFLQYQNANIEQGTKHVMCTLQSNVMQMTSQEEWKKIP